MDASIIRSLTITDGVTPLASSTAPTLRRTTEQQFARFRAAITDPRRLAYFHADATIALIPIDDQRATRSGLKAARRAQRLQRKVQFLFTTEEHEFTTACAHEFTLDLRDARWGAKPHPCFDGGTAEEVRVRLSSILSARQIWVAPMKGTRTRSC